MGKCIVSEVCGPVCGMVCVQCVAQLPRPALSALIMPSWLEDRVEVMKCTQASMAMMVRTRVRAACACVQVAECHSATRGALQELNFQAQFCPYPGMHGTTYSYNSTIYPL